MHYSASQPVDRGRKTPPGRGDRSLATPEATGGRRFTQMFLAIGAAILSVDDCPMSQSPGGHGPALFVQSELPEANGQETTLRPVGPETRPYGEGAGLSNSGWVEGGLSPFSLPTGRSGKAMPRTDDFESIRLSRAKGSPTQSESRHHRLSSPPIRPSIASASHR